MAIKYSATILKPNYLMTELDYNFDANNNEECAKIIYNFLQFTSTEQYLNEVPFPVKGGKLNKAYPELVFEPNKSIIMKGYIENSFNNNKDNVLVALKYCENNNIDVLVL
tara:strand:+ start:772 stop:1101 length:330 start_codon:yes stop_codon:yes gene_type:complete